MNQQNLDHFYTYGDVYETLDTIQQLEFQLGRLKRQQLITEDEWVRSKNNVIDIRDRLESRINAAALQPRGPSLP